MTEEKEAKAIYEIRVEGSLGEMWRTWFAGMSIRQETNPGGHTFSLITGPIEDQPALHGLLSQIRDLNLTLVSIKRIEE